MINIKDFVYLRTMKKVLLSLFVVCFSFCFGQTTAIPDPAFEQELINLGYDTGTPDGAVPTANISGVTGLNLENQNIADLTGIEDFTALNTLWCYTNQLTSLDVSNNTALTTLRCGFN